MKITLDDFYGTLRDCVKYYPDCERKCLQLRGFRVVQGDGVNEIMSDNMGATACDAGKPYFFSKDWENNGKKAGAVIGSLPVLTAFERVGFLETPFDKGQKKSKQIALTVWDRYNQAKCAGPNCSGCEARTINEIYRDTEIMLMNVLYYLGGVVLATTDADQTPRLYHSGFLESMKAGGAIGSFTSAGSLKNTMQPQGKQFQIYKESSITNFMYGSATIIDVRVDACLTQEFDFTKVDKKLLAQEAGCKNC